MSNKSYKHWIVIILMCGLAGSSIGLCNNSVGVFYTPVSESLGVLRGTFALHATLSLLATAITALFIPTLFKKYNYKKLLILGTIMAVAATVTMAYSHNMMMFYICGIVRGLGTGLYAIMPITTIIGYWFEKKHGLATSIALSFSGLSGAICSPLLTSCIEKYGWSNAYLVMAALIGIFCLPAILYPFTIHPQDMGLLPYGQVEVVEKKEKKEIHFNYLTITFLLMAVLTLLHTSITGVSQHLSGMSISIGLSATVGSLLMSCTMIGNIFSKLLIGILSDHFKPVKACIMMILCNIGALVLLIIGHNSANTTLLMAGALLFGTIYSVGAVGIPLLTRYFFGNESYSKAYSVIGFLTSVGSSSSLTLIGYLYDFTHTYIYMFIVAIIFHMINLVIITTLSKRTH